MFDFLAFRVLDFFDIFILTIILYQTYKILRGTSGINIFTVTVSFIALWFVVSYIFQMELLGTIINAVANVGIIILVILFQDEIRSFLMQLGGRRSNSFSGLLQRLLQKAETKKEDTDIDQIVTACIAMSKTKTGALIVIQNTATLENYWSTGDLIESKIKSRLIENIFYKNTPLHDGAMIITDRIIKSAACILPISHKTNFPKKLGLRHRAALGITERTDAAVVIVSEETGKISCMQNSEMWLAVTPSELSQFLHTGIPAKKK